MSNVDSTIPAGFRQIPGFPRYAIAEDGTILSICRRGRGADVLWEEARRLSTPVAPRGYQICILCNGHGKKTATVHTLVLTAFVGPRPEGMECRHLDGNKQNNHLSNLCWGTTSENHDDRKRHGVAKQGEKSHFAKLTEDDVREIRQRHADRELYRVLASDFHVSIHAIAHIVRRNSWKHLPSPKQEVI